MALLYNSRRQRETPKGPGFCPLENREKKKILRWNSAKPGRMKKAPMECRENREKRKILLENRETYEKGKGLLECRETHEKGKAPLRFRENPKSIEKRRPGHVFQGGGLFFSDCGGCPQSKGVTLFRRIPAVGPSRAGWAFSTGSYSFSTARVTVSPLTFHSFS